MHYNFILLPLLTFASVSLARPVESAPNASILERRRSEVPVLVDGASKNVVTIKVPFKGDTKAVWKVFVRHLMEAQGLKGDPKVAKASIFGPYDWIFTFDKDTNSDPKTEHQKFITVANLATGRTPGAAIVEPEKWWGLGKGKNKNTASGATPDPNAPPPAYAPGSQTQSSQAQSSQQLGSTDPDE